MRWLPYFAPWALIWATSIFATGGNPGKPLPPRHMEALGRGVVALNQGGRCS